MNSKFTKPIVEPLDLREEDTDYDTDYSQASLHCNRLVRDVSKTCLEERKCKIRTNSKNVTFSPRTTVDSDDIAIRKQKLELNLINAQVEETLSTDLHKNLQQRYDSVATTLDALSQYVDAVCIEMKACYRLCQQLNGLLVNEKCLGSNEKMIKLTRKICKDTDLSFQYQIKEKVFGILQDKSDFSSLLTDYNDRRNDFKIASQNFKILLDTANLNIKQMDKLQKQYDKILSNYQHSRCMLDKYIPEEISERIGVLINCLCEFGEDLQRMAVERTDMSQMFQHLNSNMKIADSSLSHPRKIENSTCMEKNPHYDYTSLENK